MTAARRKKTLRIAMPSWEIGRVSSRFGAKIGGLGTVMEELPEELVAAAAERGIKLRIDLLSPCFAHYDRSALDRVGPARSVLDGNAFDYQVFGREFSEGVRAFYFWDEWQLGWTTPTAIYPDDPSLGARLYASTAQAMASFIAGSDYDGIHAHDYHVGLIPFYLPEEQQNKIPVHLTIHNATHQGTCPIEGSPYEMLFSLNLDGYRLFHEFFDFFGHLNLLKAALLKAHRSGGRITTVSGDVRGNWGYAAELRENAASLWSRARRQKWWGGVGEVFLPNRHLDVLEKVPVAGITNGLSRINWPQNLPQLKQDYLEQLEERTPGGIPLRSAAVKKALLSRDHSFDAQHLEVKATLKDLLHQEIFGAPAINDPILITVVGRLVAQKNLGLVAAVAERILSYDPGTKFIILASAPDGAGKAAEEEFQRISQWHPHRFAFIREFNEILGKLIQAGGDFMLIPSRFEPCGLVDYESCLLGTVVIGHRTGGLTKVQSCAYLYDWLDVADYWGEANVFAQHIEWAVHTYRNSPETHRDRLLRGMALDASWATSAGKYLDLYRYGQLIQDWRKRLDGLLERFQNGLGSELDSLAEFAEPALPPYGNPGDLPLKGILGRR